MKKDLLKLLDLSSQDILTILDTADQLKAMKKAGIQHPFLAGKTLAMIFEKSSTRTRVSFETGMYQLGGNAIYLSDKDSQIGRNEPVEDTARVLSRFCDGIMIRTFAQEEVETLAKYASIPVINGLTDFCHPCQVLADLMTIREHKGKLAGLKLCYIGDGNNMAPTFFRICLRSSGGGSSFDSLRKWNSRSTLRDTRIFGMNCITNCAIRYRMKFPVSIRIRICTPKRTSSKI